MNNGHTGLSLLTSYVSKRAARRGLHVDMTRLRYANRWLFQGIPQGGTALFVGIGHGHDALLALLDGYCSKVVGVDPYIETDGNGDDDFRDLQLLAKSLGLANRLEIHRETIQDYISRSTTQYFDLIVCADVLHHIFITTRPLSSSEEGTQASLLFMSLAKICQKKSQLVISETSRYGLRPLLVGWRLLPGTVDYATKQSWREWMRVGKAANWHLLQVDDYIPWAFRKWNWLLANVLGRCTLSDRYRLVFMSES